MPLLVYKFLLIYHKLLIVSDEILTFPKNTGGRGPKMTFWYIVEFINSKLVEHGNSNSVIILVL